MDIYEMTRKELEKLPMRENWRNEIECDSLIILPTRRLHDSGYRVMDFVAVLDGIPLCRCSNCSDVIHIGGIAGRNNDNPWSIDCLPKSGLLRLFAPGRSLIAGGAYSSMEVFSVMRGETK